MTWKSLPDSLMKPVIKGFFGFGLLVEQLLERQLMIEQLLQQSLLPGFGRGR